MADDDVILKFPPLKRSILIDQARHILQKPLQQLGYSFEPSPPSPPALSSEFWFEKQSKAVGGMFVIVEFQPDGFGANELFSTAINLYRGFTRKLRARKQPKDKPEQLWSVRLAPCLWDNSGKGDMDYWWHFVSVAELQAAYQDALEKIIHFGIPFLENPKSTWLDSLPDELRMRYSKD
jgi:hypothetical protein